MDNITISHILKKIIKKNDNYLGIFTPSQLKHININKYKCFNINFIYSKYFKKLWSLD